MGKGSTDVSLDLGCGVLRTNGEMFVLTGGCFAICVAIGFLAIVRLVVVRNLDSAELDSAVCWITSDNTAKEGFSNVY